MTDTDRVFETVRDALVDLGEQTAYAADPALDALAQLLERLKVVEAERDALRDAAERALLYLDTWDVAHDNPATPLGALDAAIAR